MIKISSKQFALIVSDIAFLYAAITISWYLTGSTHAPTDFKWWFIFGITVLAQLIVFLKMGLYRAVLRYASVDFLVTVLRAISVASLALVLTFYFAHINLPSRTLIVNWLMTVFLIGGGRFIVRYFFELKQRLQKGRRVLVYGAGDMGILALRQLKMEKILGYSAVGFIDDEPSKKGKILNNVKVLGPLGDLEDIVDNYKVEEVIIAIAEINGERLREVVKRCRKKNIVCRIIPCFSRLLEMNSNVRNVEPADLMRRLPRDLDLDKIKDYLHGKSILISGAAGSIGSELVKQVLRYEPKIVIAFDQSEFGLYSLRESLGDSGIKYVLGDVANKDYVENVFEMEKLDIVFHAAAYKHVPLLESNNAEAIRNNVGGTKVLAETSDKYGVKSFILISTDKAVKPSSIMGATKRACELVVQGFSSFSKTRFVAVRFGNVLGSSGSVVPKFLDQIMRGGPVTVTHPEATRYFMLIDEAVQLVLQAAAIGNGGEIFILNMGKPVKISEMAEDLIFLMGRQPHKDIKIEYIGLRDGEKVHEELLNEETEEKTRFEDITIGKTKVPEWEWFNSRIDHILKFYGDNNHETVQTLKEIVPEGEWGS